MLCFVSNFELFWCSVIILYLCRLYSVKCLVITVVNIWNSLPDSVVDADTLNTFKNRLDKHWLDQDVLYNFYSELTGTGGASICM